jgi:hypothetical protein
MVVKARILEKQVGESVAFISPSHLDIEILRAIVVEVAEGDPVAFLQMSESAGHGDIFESLSPGVPVSEIRHQPFIFWIARPQVHIQPTIVIEIAKVRTHRLGIGRELAFLGHVLKTPAPIALV